jgi:hypothetical protein
VHTIAIASLAALAAGFSNAQPAAGEDSQHILTVDHYVANRSIVPARQGSTVLLRIGNAPRFLALRQAIAGGKPSISALGFGVQGFSVDGAMRSLTAKGFTAAPSDASKPGPKQVLVHTRRANEGGSPDGSTRDLFAADPSGVVFQLHDVNYCGGSGALGAVCPMPEPSPKKGMGRPWLSIRVNLWMARSGRCRGP